MNNLLNNSKLFVKRNAPTILTCAGGAGVVATSVMAVKATPKALKRLEQAEEAKGDDLTTFEKVQAAGPVYIPAALVGVSTIACIFGANVLNKRQQAIMASAYAMLDNSYKEYKKKFREMYGTDADAEVRESIANDKYKQVDIPEDEKFDLFFDEFSGRFFKSTLEKVQKAEYQVNRDLVMQEWCTINNFYEYLGIPVLDIGDDIGWSTANNEQAYWQAWVDFSNVKAVTNDGREYYIVRMFQEPMMGFEDLI